MIVCIEKEYVVGVPYGKCKTCDKPICKSRGNIDTSKWPFHFVCGEKDQEGVVTKPQ